MVTISSVMILATEILKRASKAEKKANGEHYTPNGLAQYLAAALVRQWLNIAPSTRDITVLDPACGDGELLIALLNSIPSTLHARLHIIGCDTNCAAVDKTESRLAEFHVASITLHRQDFLSDELTPMGGPQLGLDLRDTTTQSLIHSASVDIIISNPPYVRTQVLGSRQARSLAHRFGLSGRVDLYHAFVIAMTKTLRTGGIMGLLTSNRFLSTQAGASMREWLSSEFHLSKLVDLGDTKLFEAAVLPAIVIAEKRTHDRKQLPCSFVRMYESKSTDNTARKYESVVEALAGEQPGNVVINDRRFKVEVGVLRSDNDKFVPWILTSGLTDKWMATVAANQSGVFGDVAKVCVGIKTTADKVFVRNDWESLPAEEIPEPELLHNLITHHVAERWTVQGIQQSPRKVLYPYIDDNGSRRVIALEDYPRAARYLESHRKRLQNRQYVIDAGRKWYEIWVPHAPSDWQRPKIAFPDISSQNVFFLADPGWIVNGDCYWITLAHSVPEATLYAMLAVANSTFVIRYYDVMFHNKLYAGRRRFMSQYVRRFPLPHAKFIKSLSEAARSLLAARKNGNQAREEMIAAEVDSLTWKSFGLSKEI